MLPFSVEFGSDNLDLVDGLQGAAEFTGRPEAIGIRRHPQPQLVDSRISQVQLDPISRTVLAKVEWQC